MFPQELIPHVESAFMTGSRVVVTPPVMDTDEDWVVLVPEFSSVHVRLMDDGWVMAGSFSVEDPTNFHSYKRDEVNLIVTNNRQFYSRYELATRLAKEANLKNKSARKKFFSAILYGDD